MKRGHSRNSCLLILLFPFIAISIYIHIYLYGICQYSYVFCFSDCSQQTNAGTLIKHWVWLYSFKYRAAISGVVCVCVSVCVYRLDRNRLQLRNSSHTCTKNYTAVRGGGGKCDCSLREQESQTVIKHHQHFKEMGSGIWNKHFFISELE